MSNNVPPLKIDKVTGRYKNKIQKEGDLFDLN